MNLRKGACNMLEPFSYFLIPTILAFILTLGAKKRYPLIKSGALVRTTEPNFEKRKEWTDEGWNSRQWGVQGKVINHHSGHSLYYRVQHPDKTVGYYDPSELEVVR